MEDVLRMRVAAQLQKEREKRAMSQLEFAKLLDMSQSAYHRLEKGENKVDLEQLLHISQRLDLPLYDFLPDNLNFHNHNNNSQGGVVLGNIIVHNYAPNEHEQQITLLQEKLTHAEDKIRLLENQLSVLQNLLGGQKPSSH